MVDDSLCEIPGYEAVVGHFGTWPSFHDAIVEQLSLNLPGETLLAVRTWNMTSEADERGCYQLTHRAVVKMLLTDLLELELTGTDLQAGCILFELSLAKEGDSYRLQLDPTLGAGGWIRSKGVRFEIYPDEAPAS